MLEGTPLPIELSEAAFLLRTGWSYPDYVATPDDVISSMSILINAEIEVKNSERTLENDEDDEWSSFDDDVTED